MELNLKRPLVFLDLETTGTNASKDRIVEISYLKIFPDGHRESKNMRINPECHIPEGSTAVHGITDQDVANSPKFKEVAHTVAQDLQGSDIAGFNSNRFDIPLLAEEFERAGVDIDLKKRHFIDVQTIFHKMEQRTLVAAYKFYCGKSLENAHAAAADAEATYEVLKAQLDRYPELQNDVDFLEKFTAFNRSADFAGVIVYNDKNEEVFNLGKHKGERVEDVLATDPGYYSWMENADFPLYTKRVLTRIKLRTREK